MTRSTAATALIAGTTLLASTGLHFAVEPATFLNILSIAAVYTCGDAPAAAAGGGGD